MTTTAEHALFLANHVDTLANREDVGRFRSDVFRLIESIERMVNRPPLPKYCGNCPTPLTAEQRLKLKAAGEVDEYGMPRSNCGEPLYEPNRDALEVTCWRCKHTYNIKQLFDDAVEGHSGPKLPHSEKEILGMMEQIGRPIPRGTWWSWVRRGVIQNRRDWSAEPGYYFEDAQALWEERVGKRQATG